MSKTYNTSFDKLREKNQTTNVKHKATKKIDGLRFHWGYEDINLKGRFHI